MKRITRALGKAARVDLSQMEKRFFRLLTPEESVTCVYKLIRNYWVFTSKRLITVERRGITGINTVYHSYPYKNIMQFAIETAGQIELEGVIKIWPAGVSEPLIQKFFRNEEIYEIQGILAATLI